MITEDSVHGYATTHGFSVSKRNGSYQLMRGDKPVLGAPAAGGYGLCLEEIMIFLLGYAVAKKYRRGGLVRLYEQYADDQAEGAGDGQP